MMVKHHVHHTGRSVKIDALRGVAVIGMVIAHALFFFHDKSNIAFTFLEKFFNLTVLTLFVFVFGMALSKWFDSHAHDHNKKVAMQSLKRVGLFYVVYLITSVVAMMTSKSGLNNLFSVITLQSAPSFTEYMQLFIVLSLMIPLLRPLIRYTRESLLLTFVIGAFFYLLGVTLYEIAVPDFLVGIKSIFAGGEGLLRFPVLLYLPVVLWGVWWQYDSDRHVQDKAHTSKHLWILLGSAVITVVGVLVTRFATVPILNPNIRWPPSIGFLSMGMSIATITLFLMPSLSWVNNQVKRILTYFGRDALDIWMSHLLLLFLYRYLGGPQFGNTAIVAMMVVIFIALTVLISSLHITNNIRFPFNVTFAGTTRFRIRYGWFAFIALILTIVSIGAPSSPYGNFLSAPAFTVQQKLPASATVRLLTGSQWYVKRHPKPQTLELIIVATDGQKKIPLNPDLVKIIMNKQLVDFRGVAAADGTLHFSKPVDDFPPGTYEFSANIHNSDSTITTNNINLNISEPLMVAWTFDWEGWDAPDAALQTIDNLAIQFPTLKFTHFVNPRTFLSGVVSMERREQLKTFFINRQNMGDEIAMHLHMHFDLVSGAGVATRSTKAWGLRTSEGYDVPTTEYTPEEFNRIVKYAQHLAAENGLPPMIGFRAGGWFLNTEQLNQLQSLGYSYDSSGRDRASSGPFRNISWDLPRGTQPYFPNPLDQNATINNSSGILEIPNNGVSTNDQTVQMLTTRIKDVYSEGVLFAPKTIVFVSHPQFYSQEFNKIPEVLREVSAISQINNRGPAIYVTTSEISELWHTLYK